MVFATAVRWVARKPKPKMKPIELKTPPEQTQTITRTLFDIVREHGPLTIGDTWNRVKIEIGAGIIFKASPRQDLGEMALLVLQGGWFDGLDKQKTYENTAEMDERKAEAAANLQPCRCSQAIPVHNVVYEAQGGATKTWTQRQ